MTWGDHVEAISTKINRRLGLLKRISYLLPLETRITLYNSLVRPLFDYGDTISGEKGNATLMNDLQVLQNKAAKIILSLPSFYSSAGPKNFVGQHFLNIGYFTAVSSSINM